MIMAQQHGDGGGGAEDEEEADRRARSGFGSWSEYSIDLSQFQGGDGSVNDFRWKSIPAVIERLGTGRY